MQCAKCGVANREGRRFCSECGAALAGPCAVCGFVNDPGEKFCGGCGIALASGSPPTAAEPAPPTRPATVASTNGGPELVEATRRQLTVMFCDLVGSTALSQQLDPEELTDVLTAYQDTCAQVIKHFDGHISRYVGDALLVYFGYPQAHEDDAQRAVRTALGIVEAMKALNFTLDRPEGTLAVRIGIATGLVVISDIGRGERREKAAIVGETPNLAARLQALAQPNTVVIGATTARLVEGLFVWDDLGPQMLKGIAQPVAAYLVREASGAYSRFEAKARRHGLIPLVGREEEISPLLRRWEQAKAGEGQVVLISGESGLGKSRILQGFRERMYEELRNRILYYCSPYHRDTPFYPQIDQLQRALRFQKPDSADRKLDKLSATLRLLGLPEATLAPLFASLVSIPTGDRYPPLSASPEDIKKRTMDACLRVMEAMAAQSPVLMAAEDLHWIDASTLELLKHLIERIPSNRVLFVATSRPEFEWPWGDRPYITRVALRRLTRGESAALVQTVAGGKPLPDEVLEQIVARTDGVPLFVEELTKTALESGALEDRGDSYALSGPLPAFAIPASLHESLMARLDRLAPVKEVAQVAAALGRTFTRELLASISRVADSALENALAQLVDAELIYRRGLPPDVIYEFKHALVQDVAYGSLLRNKRQQLHQEIAKSLQRQSPDWADRHPELLAHHFREAALPEQAIPYGIRAGDAAAARFARTEATAHYQGALDMARALPPSGDASRAQIRAILKLASVASNRPQFERDLKNLAEARTIAERIGDQPLLSQVLYWIGRANYVFGRFDAGIEHAAQALAIAEALGGDDSVTADPVSLLARIHCLTGEPKQASTYAARSVEQMHRLGNRAEEAAVAGVLAFAYGLHGRFPQAFEAAERGIEVAGTTEHLPTLAACFMFRGVVKGWRGELAAAVGDFDEAIATSQKAGDLFRRYLAHGFRGEAYLIAGEPTASEAELAQCLALGGQIGTSYHRTAFQAFLAEARLEQGDVDEALRITEKALEVSSEKAQEWSHSIALRIRGEALAAAQPPELERAEEAVLAAIAIQAARECRCDLAWSHLVAGRIGHAKGELDAARRSLAAAEGLFAEMGVARGRQLAQAAAALVGRAAPSGARAF